MAPPPPPPSGPQALAEGLECSICLELLCEPMQLPCSHVFCRRCLAGLVRQKRRCALCRAGIPESFDPMVAPLHRPLEQVLMRQCTVEYMQRVEDVALEAAHLVRLRIGNGYELLGVYPRVRHRWKVTVELEAQPEACLPYGAALPDVIKHVRFRLLPACRVLSAGSRAASEDERTMLPPRYVEVDASPFQVTATSPTSCTIPIVITWQDWVRQPPLRLEHVLDFTRDGGCWDYGVDLHAAFTGDDGTGGAAEPAPPAFPGLEAATPASVGFPSERGASVGFPSERGAFVQSLDDTSSADGSPALAQQARTRRRSTGMLSVGLARMRRHLPRVRLPLRMSF